MNYQKHYDALIERARLRNLDAKTESHHVVPRCMGGSNAKSNRVDLTPEEHFVAHQLLVKLYPDHKGIVKAAAMMVTNRSAGRTKNKTYGWLRRLHYEARVGMPCPPETRAAISRRHKESDAAKAARAKLHAAQVGRKRTEASIKKMSEAKKGVPLSEETRRKMSEVRKGREISPEHRLKLSAALKGKRNSAGTKKSPEARAKLSAAKAGKKLTEEQLAALRAKKTPEERSAIIRQGWETRRAKVARSLNADKE